MDTAPLERLLVILFHDHFCPERGLGAVQRMQAPLVDFVDWFGGRVFDPAALLERADASFADWEELAGVLGEPRLEVLAPLWYRVLAAGTPQSKARLRGLSFIALLRFTDGGMTRLQADTTTKEPEGLDAQGATGACVALVRELVGHILSDGLDKLRDENNVEWPQVLALVRAAFKAYEPSVPLGQLAAYRTLLAAMAGGADPPPAPDRFQPGPSSGGPGGWSVPT